MEWSFAPYRSRYIRPQRLDPQLSDEQSMLRSVGNHASIDIPVPEGSSEIGRCIDGNLILVQESSTVWRASVSKQHRGLISRHHAMLWRTGETLTITDNCSRNGTYVSSKTGDQSDKDGGGYQSQKQGIVRLEGGKERALRAGDTFSLGSPPGETPFTFRWTGNNEDHCVTRAETIDLTLQVTRKV